MPELVVFQTMIILKGNILWSGLWPFIQIILNILCIQSYKIFLIRNISSNNEIQSILSYLSIIVMSFFSLPMDSCSDPFDRKSWLNPGIIPMICSKGPIFMTFWNCSYISLRVNLPCFILLISSSLLPKLSSSTPLISPSMSPIPSSFCMKGFVWNCSNLSICSPKNYKSLIRGVKYILLIEINQKTGKAFIFIGWMTTAWGLPGEIIQVIALKCQYCRHVSHHKIASQFDQKSFWVSLRLNTNLSEI